MRRGLGAHDITIVRLATLATLGKSSACGGSHLGRGGGGVTQYRVYCFDGSNRIERAETIEADNDEVALELARLAAGDCLHFELWDRNRKVKRVSRPA